MSQTAFCMPFFSAAKPLYCRGKPRCIVRVDSHEAMLRKAQWADGLMLCYIRPVLVCMHPPGRPLTLRGSLSQHLGCCIADGAWSRDLDAGTSLL